MKLMKIKHFQVRVLPGALTSVACVVCWMALARGEAVGSDTGAAAVGAGGAGAGARA